MIKNPCFIPVIRNTLILSAITLSFGSSTISAAEAPGGFLDKIVSDVVRAIPTRNQILNLLPDRGAFNFPAPYNSQAIRLTNASDCGGADCVNDVGYSYWRNTNNHVGQDSMLIFLGLSRNKGGTGPNLFQYNKVSNHLTKLGPLFDDNVSYAWHSGEGMYFSATMPTALYVSDQTRIQRYDVMTKKFDTVYDISKKLGSNYHLWQVHSSDDDKVHSATVRDSRSGNTLGCVAYREDIDRSYYYPKKGDYDECQIDKSGQWLVIKENVDGRNGEDNRIITLATGQERLLLDEHGAGGHSDLGHGYMVAVDNWSAHANSIKIWRFDTPKLEGQEVFYNNDWSFPSPNHISHTNSMRGVNPQQQFACGSSVNRKNVAVANEIICFTLDGSMKSMVVAPVMTDLNAALGRDDYTNSPKGNLDVTGKYFIWTSNAGGSRMDAFLVKVPDHLLTGGTIVAPLPPKPPVLVPPVEVPSKPVEKPAVDEPASIRSIVVNATVSSAQINWSTNEAAENLVYFGTTPDYGRSSTLNTVRRTTHSVTLTGLAANTLYHFRVYVRDAGGNITASENQSFRTPGSSSATGGASVNWKSVTNASISGTTLKKIRGCEGCADAGAISDQSISNMGYFEFKPSPNHGLHYVGLSDSSSLHGLAIDFGVSIYRNLAEIRENGRYLGDIYFKEGDVIRIGVTNGKVTYMLNGKVFYTSRKTASTALRAIASLYSTNSSVRDAVIAK